MGRIKTMLIKRVTNQLIKEHPGVFKKSFEENKELVGRYAMASSKKLRNIVAGYVTRLMNKAE